APGAVRNAVHRGGPAVIERLRAHVRARLPSDEPESPVGRARSLRTPDPEREREGRLRDLRLSAACLLAIGEAWDDDVAEALRATLTGRPSLYRDREAAAVMRLCANQAPAQAALFAWIADASTLGDHARDIARDVAPVVEGMADGVLERTAGSEGTVRDK